MADSLRIAICEDTQSEEEKLLEILAECSIPAECIWFKSGEEFLSSYKPDYFDLVLMDIYMDGINGIDTISKLRETDREIPVAFITTSTDFTLESYRLSALKYIEKPFKQQDIEDMLQLADMKRNNAPSLIFQKNGKIEKAVLSKIVFLEQHSRQVVIHMYNKENIEIYDKLASLCTQIESDLFFNCHKSFVVNLNYVKYIDEELKCFVMRNGENVPIRRESIHDARQVFEDFLFNGTRENVR